jgi:hypothetical protein
MRTSFSIFLEIEQEQPIDLMKWYTMMSTGGNADFEMLSLMAATSERNHLGFNVMVEAFQLIKITVEELLLEGLAINDGAGLFYLNLIDSGKILEMVFFPEDELVKERLAEISKSDI